jgi:hypothetical protein
MNDMGAAQQEVAKFVAELRGVIVRRSTAISAHRPSSFDISCWVSLRWERGNRYFRTHLEQDLWGHWTLTRVAGRKDTPRGRYMTSWVASLEAGLMTLGGIAKRRRERGYRLVS